MQAENNNIIQPTKKSHRILVLILVILLTAGAIGGGVYYVLNQQIKKQDKLIEDLQKQDGALKNENTAEQEEVKIKVGEKKSDRLYEDSVGNYSISIPDDYIITIEGSCEGLCSDTAKLNKKKTDTSFETTFFSIRATDYNKQIVLNDWIKEANKDINLDSEIEDVKIGGVSAKKYTSNGMLGTNVKYYFVKGGVGYEISDVVGWPNFVSTETIINTFKFKN